MRCTAFFTLNTAFVCMLLANASLAAEELRPIERHFRGAAKPLQPVPLSSRAGTEENSPRLATGSRGVSQAQHRLSTSDRSEARRISNRGRQLSVSSDVSKTIGSGLLAQTSEVEAATASERLRSIRSADPDLDDLDEELTSDSTSTVSESKEPTALTPVVPRHRIATHRIPDRTSEGNGSNLLIDRTSENRPTSPARSGLRIQRSNASNRFNSTSTSRTSKVLLTNAGPTITVQASGPPTIVIGKSANYTVSIANHGSVLAHDLTVNIGVPSWAEITSSKSYAGSTQIETDSQQNSVIQWKIRQLAPRSKESLQLTLVPRASRTIDLAVRWTFSPTDAMAQIAVLEPKLQLTLSGPEDVLYGDTKIYTITLSNPGSGDSENVVLNLLPVTPNTEASGGREIGTLKAGARKSIEIELTAHQAGRLQIRAHAFADGGLRAEASQDVIVRRANLQVTAAGPGIKYTGATASYKLRVSNTGDATARDVVLAAVLPAGAKYVSSTDGGKLDAQQGQVVWHVGPLRHGAVRVFDLQCTLTSPGDNRLDIRSQAAGDLSAARSVITTVEALADLKLTVNDPRGAVPVGVKTEYEVRIVNRGSKAAESIQVAGFFGPGVEPISIQGWQGNISKGQVEFEPIGRLNAGQELVFTITARAEKAGTHRFRVELKCENPETELSAEESTKYYEDETRNTVQAAIQPLGPLPLGPARR